MPKADKTKGDTKPNVDVGIGKNGSRKISNTTKRKKYKLNCFFSIKEKIAYRYTNPPANEHILKFQLEQLQCLIHNVKLMLHAR